MNSNAIKTAQLGMPFGTANGRLRKMIIFHLLILHNENICYRCNRCIEFVEDLSIEHKTAWLNNDPKLFWDLSNIAFSHLACNVGEPRTNKTHCPKGHAYDKDNTYIPPNRNSRICKLCKIINKRNFRSLHPEQDTTAYRQARGWGATTNVNKE